ncbi:MAG: hypothetical protein ACSHYB_02510 [Roseibacillus sp.]
MTSPFSIFFLLLLFAPLLSGDVLAEFQQGEATDSQLSRLPALFVDKGQPATPLLNAGPFEVTWTGALQLEKRQRLYFSFEGNGSATLTINGEMVLQESGTLGTAQSERLRLNSGEHEFTLHYQSPSDEEEARFQLFWEERAFPREPIPPSAFGEVDPTLAEHTLVYQGREIFARHLCSKCHLPTEGFGSQAMPELTQIPPILGLTGDRLNEPWLAHWIANPASIRPDTNMPRLVADNEEGRQQAADLAAYLMTMKTGAKSPPIAGSIQEGGATFHKLACVTCHELPDETTPSHDRVPLSHLSAKFKPSALRDFLLEPSKLSPHTRMPDFRLSEEEAANLTSYLLDATSKGETKTITFPTGNAANGPALSTKMQCGACHAGLPFDPSAMPPFESIVKTPWESAPCYESETSHLNLPPEAGQALESLRSQHLESLKKDTPVSLAERQLRSLRCTACHSQDDMPALLGSQHSQSAFLAAHLKIEEKVDQSLPSLTHTGEMLHTSYLSSILKGEAQPRPRPWLDARMPGFANHSPDTFAAGIAALHGLSPSQPVEKITDLESITIGEKLIGSEAGFGCTTCHGVGEAAPTAAFEVVGINFDLTKHRLRETFFYRWMHNPTRINSATKMPRYADEEGKTPLLDFGNDRSQQFEAIWSYLHSR